MGTILTGAGDSNYRTPGTSKQTGNNAVKYGWVHDPIGRVAKCAGLCCAYHLGWTDGMMAARHSIPPAAHIMLLFVRLMPFFPAYYDRHRRRRAREIRYEDVLEPFNAGDIENRVRYCFATPGSRLHTKERRKYGISREHPVSVEQQYKLRVIWARCSEKVTRRLRFGMPILREEAYAWGLMPGEDA